VSCVASAQRRRRPPRFVLPVACLPPPAGEIWSRESWRPSRRRVAAAHGFVTRPVTGVHGWGPYVRVPFDPWSVENRSCPSSGGLARRPSWTRAKPRDPIARCSVRAAPETGARTGDRSRSRTRAPGLSSPARDGLPVPAEGNHRPGGCAGRADTRAHGGRARRRPAVTGGRRATGLSGCT